MRPKTCHSSWEGYSWLLSLFTWGFLWEGRGTTSWAEGAGCSCQLSLVLSALGEDRGCDGCGDNLPPLQGSVSCCLYRECSSAPKSGPFTRALLTPDLTKGLLTICLGTSGKTLESPSPFSPPRELLSAMFRNWGAPTQPHHFFGTALGFSLRCRPCTPACQDVPQFQLKLQSF